MHLSASGKALWWLTMNLCKSGQPLNTREMNRYKLDSIYSHPLLKARENYLDEGCPIYTDIVVAPLLIAVNNYLDEGCPDLHRFSFRPDASAPASNASPTICAFFNESANWLIA